MKLENGSLSEILSIVRGGERAMKDVKSLQRWSAQIEQKHNIATSTVIDWAWDESEHLGRKDLARRCEKILNWLTCE